MTAETPRDRAGAVPYDCPFCKHLASEPPPAGNALAVAFPDGFPVSPGHTLIVPRRHVASYLETTKAEKQALWELADEVCAQLMEADLPDGFNIGLNAGIAAGQTVMHVHLHVIPRYAGDMPDPRGGVRHVIPAKAKYWA